MRNLLPICFLFISFSLSAQTTFDSLSYQATAGSHLLNKRDTLTHQIQYARAQLDSLPMMPRSRADSLRVARYMHRQRDSLHQQITSWRAKRDSLLSPLDTLQHRVDNAKSRARAWQDSLSQPARETSEIVRTAVGEHLPNEVTDALSASTIKSNVPELNLPKITPQLPDLPSPVHAVRDRMGTWQEKLSSYTGEFSKYQGKLSSYTSSLSPGSEVLEQQSLQHVPGGEVLQQQHTALQSWSAEQFAHDQQRAQLQQRVLTTAQDHFAEHSEVLQEAQTKLTGLKKKYSTVEGDVRQKRSSLQGTPFGERLVYGGTMQINRTPSLTVDLSPQLAYQWNKRISTGVGGTYRLTLSEDYRSISTDNAVYGGRAFTEYGVFQGFLLHGEYERMSQASPVINQDASQRTWQTSLLAGIGKTYRIGGQWQGSVLVLYNFRHQKQDIHGRPWVFRFGFRRARLK